MPDRMRWRYGNTNPIQVAVAPEIVIEIGDLIWLSEQCLALPAIEIPDRDSRVMQTIFADGFIGVAETRSLAGELEPVRVAQTGAFEFDCDPQGWRNGDMVTGCQNGGEAGLCNQRVARTTDPLLSIGRVARDYREAVTSVLVELIGEG
jgi:hypothetical protein